MAEENVREAVAFCANPCDSSKKLQLLFKFFCNNLHLGQWELAQLCIQELNQGGISVKGSLETVALFPYKISSKVPFIDDPHHLSWLCWKAINSLDVPSEEEDFIKKDVQFRLLLVEACQFATPDMLKELYLLHQRLYVKTPRQIDFVVPKLSSECRTFLQRLLYEKPSIGHSVLQAISVIDVPVYFQHNQEIQGLYVNCLQLLLHKNPTSGAINCHNCNYCKETPHIFSTSENLETLVQKFYQLLSLYDPHEDTDEEPLHNLFCNILQAVYGENQWLKLDLIYSCLLGRTSLFLLEKFSQLDNDRQCSKTCSQNFLHLARNKDKLMWKDVYLLCIKEKQHFFDMLMQSAIQLIHDGDFDELQHLLDPTEFQVLKPLVLLLGWNHCYSCSNANKLLNALWGQNDSIQHDPVIEQACKKLVYQVELVQWCLEKAKPLLIASGASLTHHDRATEMFQGLEAHSVLYVLHQSTQLSTLDMREVLEILQKRPVLKEECEPTDKLRPKSVRFAEKLEAANQVTKTPVSIEQERDIAIFRSYCALKYFMDAMHFCAVSSNSVPRKPSVTGSQDRENTDEQNEFDFQMIYDMFVTANLNAGKDQVSKLHPLTYRVETLENIFSLLFMTQEDIQEVAMLLTDSGEEMTEDPNTSVDFVESSMQSMDSFYEKPEDSDPDDRDKFTKISNKLWRISRLKSDNQEMLPLGNDLGAHGSGNDSGAHGSGNDSGAHGSDVMYDEPFNRSNFRNRSSSREQSPAKSNLKTSSTEFEVYPPPEPKKPAEDLSNFSTGSASSSYKLGFIANQYVVRDFLGILNDCLLELDSTMYRLIGDKMESSGISSSIEKALNHHMRCSITEETLQARISRLRQYVSEAQWRFQLVSNTQIPSEWGKVLSVPVEEEAEDSSDEDLDVSLFQDETISTPKTSRRRSQEKGLPNKSTQSGKESESQVTTDGDGNISTTSHGQHRRKHHTSQRKESSPSCVIMKTRRGIIPYMLASHQSLLTMCLRRGRFAQAKQFVKLFKLEDTPEALEMAFADQYQVASRKLQAIDPRRRGSMPLGGVRPRSSPNRISMKAIGNVAAAGEASMNITTIVDEVLSSSSLPLYQESALQDIDASPGSAFASHLQVENVPTMVVLDLACTACRTFEASENLLTMGQKRLSAEGNATKSRSVSDGKRHSVVEADNKKHGASLGDGRNETLLKGVETFLQQLWTLVSQISGESAIMTDEIWCNLVRNPLNQVLTNCAFPLDIAPFRNYMATLLEMQRGCNKMEKAFTEVAELQRNSLLPKSPTEKKRASRPVVHIAMKHLLQVFDKMITAKGVLVHFERHNEAIIEPTRNYLQNLYDHVKTFSHLMMENEPKPKDPPPHTQNYYLILEDSPTNILGKMMFEKKISPDKLEPVAKRLSLDLLHIIVNSCCPRIPSKQIEETSKLEEPTYESSRLVLNCSTSHPMSKRKPDVVARELMTRLVQLLKEKSSGTSGANFVNLHIVEELLSTMDLSAIFNGVQELASVDLNDLVTSSQKKSFYANVTNLLTIHSLFYQFKTSKSSLHHLSLHDRVNILNTFSYRIGQLGVVSLLELRYLIGRNGLPPPSCFNRLLSNRLHGLDPEDPWAKYGLSPEPRLLFLLIDGTLSSPPLQVVSTELVAQQLEMAMETYLENIIQVSEDTKKVTIPELLLWYRRDFVGEKGDHYLAEHEGLLNFVAEHSPSPLSASLRNLLGMECGLENSGGSTKRELPFEVSIDSYKSDFAIRFDYTPIKLHQKLASHHQHRRGSSLPPDLEGSISEYLGSGSDSHAPSSPRKVYNLRAVTLDYMKARCTLVSTLISLVCSDEIDDIEENFDDAFYDSYDHTLPQGPRKRAGSDISMVDVRSYRYQKLSQNFPVLYQHVQENVIPLARAYSAEIAKHADPMLKLLSSSIPKSIRECMLTMASSQQFIQDIDGILRDLVRNKKWQVIVDVIDSIPEMLRDQKPKWENLRNFSLCCCAKDGAPLHQYSPKWETGRWRFLEQINDPTTQVRAVLGTLTLWSVSVCLDLLAMCLSLPGIDDGLKMAVEKQLEAMKLYRKIIECAHTLQVKLSILSKDGVTREDEQESVSFEYLTQITTWQSVVKHSKQTPEEILKILVRCQEFRTLRRWAEIHNVGPIMRQNIEESYVVYLLEQDKPKPMDAYIALEEVAMKDVELCCKICDNLMKRLENQENMLFVARFQLQHLGDHLSSKRRNDLYLICMGTKILLSLPDTSRPDYVRLQPSPMLLFEQLLMNMKIDWAGRCLEIIKKDLKLIPGHVEGCDITSLDEAITKYARYALEFPIVQMAPIATPSPTLSMSSKGGESPKPSLVSDEERDKMTSLTEPNKLQSVTLGMRRGSRQFLSSTMLRSTATASQQNSLTQFKGSPLTRHLNLNAGGQFIMPVEPPTKEKWVPDTAVVECMVCQSERFSMFNRRHHCRRCGRVVCASCSARTTIIRGQSARTCDDCYEQMFRPRGDFSEQDFYQQRLIERLSGASPSSSVTATPPLVGSAVISTVIQSIPIATPDFWRLALEEETNNMTRDEFYYEQSPSTSLCISILDLHSNPKVCGEQMLQLCDELSKMLKPISPGVANPEVDYNFVISMMKYLLINAKLKFLKCSESQGEGRCEMYQSKVDLLNLLVSNNCKDILSLQELTKVDAVRRLRDRLIEDERLSLAMEVSTKCGIDPSGVWAAWGFGCLQSGDYTAAREKFSRCLKVPVDRNQTQTSSKLLNDVVESIESLPSTGTGGVKCMLAQLSLSEGLTAEPLKQYTDETTMDELQFKECLYYLKTYGTHMVLIVFFRRHGFWQKAVKYILDKKCHTDIFVEGLLIPALQNGDLGKLQDQLAMIDSTLAPWNTYLTASCRYLNRMKYHSILYKFQLFMKDYVRAAMTCISTFFIKGAVSQPELRGRLQHLLNAKQHFEMYLTQSKFTPANKAVPDWGKQNQDASVRLSQSTTDVQRHLRTIALQIDVTQFLHQAETEGASANQRSRSISPLTYPPGQVPTLFGNNKQKGEVAISILLSGGKFSDGFNIAYRIIQENRLGATVIFSQVGRQLAKVHQYGMIRQLLSKINELSICDDTSYDEVIGACVRVIADDASEGKEAESLIKITKLDTNKINAYMLCGKLKSAYLIAVKRNSEEDIKRIAGAAERAGQSAMYEICQKWLKQRQGKK